MLWCPSHFTFFPLPCFSSLAFIHTSATAFYDARLDRKFSTRLTLCLGTLTPSFTILTYSDGEVLALITEGVAWVDRCYLDSVQDPYQWYLELTTKGGHHITPPRNRNMATFALRQTMVIS